MTPELNFYDDSYVPKDIFKQEDEASEKEETTSEKSQTQKLKEKFQEGVKNIIPGLDPDTILENLAEKCKPLQDALKPIQDSIYYIKQNSRISEEEKKQRIEKLKEQKQKQLQEWKESKKEFVTKTINDIKADFGEIKFGIENMTVMVPIIISQIALPTFIGTGAPNPARIAADGMAYKRMLQGMVHPLTTAACKMLDNCDSIGFDLPNPILKVVESVTTLDNLISSIPG